MMSCKKGKHFERDIIFNESYLTAHVKINYETDCIGRLSECIQDHHDS